MKQKHVDLVFIQPGHPSSARQAFNTEQLHMEMARMGKSFGIAHAEGSVVFAVRNACLARKGQRKDQKPFEGMYDHYDRMIWIDSDNLVNTEAVMRLLSHDVDIVSGWYRTYSVGDLSDSNKASCGLWREEDGHLKIQPYLVGEMEGLPKNEQGLIEVDYTGFGLIVIKKGVFEALEYPWFRSWVYEWKQDVVDKESGFVLEKDVPMADIMTEDSGFCMMAREKGYRVWVDPLVRILHQKPVLV